MCDNSRAGGEFSVSAERLGRRLHEHWLGSPSTGLAAPSASSCRSGLLCRHQADTSSSRRSPRSLDPSSARELPNRLRSSRLTPHLFPSYSLLINECGFFAHEDGWYEESAQHVQLAYAPYAASLATIQATSLLGVGWHIRPRVTERGRFCRAHRRLAPPGAPYCVELPLRWRMRPRPFRSVARWTFARSNRAMPPSHFTGISSLR